MMTAGNWETVYLCSNCGCVTRPLGYITCKKCGATGRFMALHIQTSRRFVVTNNKKWWNPFSRRKGYYEYSGKTADGGAVSPELLSGKRVFNGSATIAAAGIASGLF